MVSVERGNCVYKDEWHFLSCQFRVGDCLVTFSSLVRKYYLGKSKVQ